MTSRASLAGSPAPLTIDGQEYLMSPLRDLDLGELDRWVQKRILQTAELSDDETTRRLGIEVASVATWTGKYGYALSRSPEGVARYMLIGLRRNHPNLKLDTVLGWVTDPTDDYAKRAEMHKAFDLANDVTESLKKKEGNSDPTVLETKASTATSSTPS